MMTVLCCDISMAQDAATGKKNTVQTKKIPQPVNIEITTHLGDQQHFVEQDVISFFINLDRAAFIYAFYQDASGNVFQIIPSEAQTEHYFKPGFYIPFPPKNSTFQFVVQAPFGKEQLWVFASNEGQLRFKGKNTVHGVKQLSYAQLELTEYIRAASGQLFGQASLIIHTRGK